MKDSMDEKELNIVALIESNPITKLSKNYNNKLLNKIKEEFSNCLFLPFIAT